MEFALPGLVLGYASSNGRFCLNSGFADAAFRRDFRKVNILFVAILVQVALHYFLMLNGPMPSLGAHSLALLLAGGFLFGLFMPVSGGCPGGILFKAAEGQLSAVFALFGFIAAMGVAYASPLAAPLQAFHQSIPVADFPFGKTVIAVSSFFALLLLGYLLFMTKNAKADGAAWSWKTAGLTIGLTGSTYALLAQKNPAAAPLGFMPGIISAWSGKLAPEVWFVGAVLLGGVIAAHFRRHAQKFPHTPVGVGSVRLRSPQVNLPLQGKIYLIRFAGGFGLGCAASLAAGCSVGYSLTFLPLLSLQAFIAITAMFVGRIVAEKIRLRIHLTAKSF